jgi:hypothetical protein
VIARRPRGRRRRWPARICQEPPATLVCPYCVAQWISAGFAVGYVRAPKLTRLLAAMWTAYAISDGLQLAYLAAEERA